MSLCSQGGDTHTHAPVQLATNAVGVLVNRRRCVDCGHVEEKPYGAGGGKPWETAR